MGRVLVAGSINIDLVPSVLALPVPGQTVLGSELAYHPGGKGANQAVAASRAGAAVTMIGAVGEDRFGDRLVAFPPPTAATPPASSGWRGAQPGARASPAARAAGKP